MKTVYIASPYSSHPKRNTIFARKALRHAIVKNVVPIVPHLLYPQVLDDSDENERSIGLLLGLELLIRCDELWVYGKEISCGMQAEIAVATEFQIPIKYIEEME